jgi:hypothetical protein
MAHVFNLSIRVALSALVLALSACGGDAPSSSAPSSTATEGPTATETPPTATAPSAQDPPPDAPTPTPTSTPTAAAGEDQPGGGGDEAEARVPVAVTVGSDGTISPGTVSVPAFLALELQVRNRTASALRVSWDASEPKGAFTVGVGKVGTRRVAGLKRGTYFLSIDGAGTAAVMAGAEPGP